MLIPKIEFFHCALNQLDRMQVIILKDKIVLQDCSSGFKIRVIQKAYQGEQTLSAQVWILFMDAKNSIYLFRIFYSILVQVQYSLLVLHYPHIEGLPQIISQRTHT